MNMEWIVDPKYVSPVLITCAHPDDEAMIGGTIAKMIKQECEVFVFVATNGSAGKNGNEINREEEFKKACKLLGATPLTTKDFNPEASINDNKLTFNNLELRDILIDVVNKIKPKTVLAPYHKDPHQDHRVINYFTAYAVFRNEYNSKLKNHVVTNFLEYELRKRIDHPNIKIDVTKFFEKKIQAAKLHFSQFGEEEHFETFFKIRHLKNKPNNTHKNTQHYIDETEKYEYLLLTDPTQLIYKH